MTLYAWRVRGPECDRIVLTDENSPFAVKNAIFVFWDDDKMFQYPHHRIESIEFIGQVMNGNCLEWTSEARFRMVKFSAAPAPAWAPE